MSAEGAPALSIVDGAARLRVAVIAAQWHATVMGGLLDGARRAVAASQVRDVAEVRVPGTFELPVAAARVATADFDAIVALGVVIRGGTPHFEYVGNAATDGLTQVSVRTGIPVGFGVLTCDTDEQALDRAGLPGSKEDKGYEATVAAMSAAIALAHFDRP
jgi:6,7-dimethyl-8-ribityllumazine synthase